MVVVKEAQAQRRRAEASRKRRERTRQTGFSCSGKYHDDGRPATPQSCCRPRRRSPDNRPYENDRFQVQRWSVWLQIDMDAPDSAPDRHGCAAMLPGPVCPGLSRPGGYRPAHRSCLPEGLVVGQDAALTVIFPGLVNACQVVRAGLGQEVFDEVFPFVVAQFLDGFDDLLPGDIDLDDVVWVVGHTFFPLTVWPGLTRSAKL